MPDMVRAAERWLPLAREKALRRPASKVVPAERPIKSLGLPVVVVKVVLYKAKCDPRKLTNAK